MNIIPKKTLCVGLTGGIGSGKSTVATFFSKLDVPIIDADVIAHQLTQKNADAYKKIVAHFGVDILNSDDTIDRKKLRDLVFKNDSDKKWLEKTLHPLIRTKMRNLIGQVEFPYCICVIPLLAESRGIDFIDRILVVDTPEKTQIERTIKRDDATQSLIQKIINSQASRSDRLKIADDVLLNDGDLLALENKIKQLHKRYLSISKNETI